jgi:hypothetical protein
MNVTTLRRRLFVQLSFAAALLNLEVGAGATAVVFENVADIAIPC